MIGLVALAVAGAWINPGVREDIAACRYFFDGKDNAEYEARQAEIKRDWKQTDAEARELDDRCQIFVLGQAEQALFPLGRPNLARKPSAKR